MTIRTVIGCLFLFDIKFKKIKYAKLLKIGRGRQMIKTSKQYKDMVQILKEELIPAMGCTEPIAIAYAAAKAREVLSKTPERVVISVSGNLIKNAKSAVVPHTNGKKGIKVAAALGIIAGRADKKLEVIANVSSQEQEALEDYLQECTFEVRQLETERTFDLIMSVYSETSYATVRIIDSHTNIVYIEKDHVTLLTKKEAVSHSCTTMQEKGQQEAKANLTLEAIFDFANTVIIEDVKAILDKQIQYNMAIAEEGMRGEYGANIGKTILKAYGTDLRSRAIAKAAAGSDARMSGCELPVVINSGSGNQGITVSVPVIEYARELGCSEEKLYRALVLSNLIAIHEKSGIGRLSAYCGAVSAGCAAGCGIAYLYDGSYKEIAHTLVNSVAIVSGMICDGAKPSCAAKIASSVEAGILGYHMYQNGQQFRAGDGIVRKGAEATIKNIARLGKEGMRETDKEITKMMLGE